jgi:glucose-6-phosphate 1-dehydrogenase
VTITLRSGKALARRDAEVVVRIKPVRHLPQGFTGAPAPDELRFALGPDTMSLGINVNSGADPLVLDRATLQADLGEGAQVAYAEVLSGILDGDAMLSVRGDAAEQCWRIVQPVLDAWRANLVPMDEYPAGAEAPAGWPAL